MKRKESQDLKIGNKVLLLVLTLGVPSVIILYNLLCYMATFTRFRVTLGALFGLAEHAKG